MKTRFARTIEFLSMLGVTIWTDVPNGQAQTNAYLGIQTCVGLTITGAVGSVYSIEYARELGETNNDWRCLTFVQAQGGPYLWVDKTRPAAERRFYRAVSLEVPTNMVCLQPGTFQPGIFNLGTSEGELDRQWHEGPQTTVTISRGFLMGKYEVTQQEYETIIGSNPSWFTGESNRPVEQVSWYDAANYCARLTQQERSARRIPTNCIYRLPTEAEWEYACRAGTTTRFSYGDDFAYANLTNYAWYSVNSDNTTHPVGQKQPNPWGLYDMHGNVWEWCQDWDGYYPGGSVVDLQGPAAGDLRVIRGASFLHDASYCRSAYRTFEYPTAWSIRTIGFRIVLAPDQP